MGVEIPKAKSRLKNKIAYSIRASQSVLQYGVGAMVDFRDRTLMTAAPEYWGGSVTQIHDERLEKILHVDYFGKPGDKEDAKYADGISYVRFPEWYFCPSCRRFKPIGEWVKEYRVKNPQKAEEDPHMIQTMKCPKCFQELVVARIITACQDGHIDDFPWVKWVHCQSFGEGKPICNKPELTITTSSSASEGLEGLTLKCLTCGATASLRGAFDPDKFLELDKKTNYRYDFRCMGNHPWKHRTESCKHPEYPKVLQRGSSSVYFPVTESSLVIPPYSNIVTTKIQDSSAYAEYKSTLAALIGTPGLPAETIELLKNTQTQTYAQKIAQEIAIPLEKVAGVLKRKNASPEDEEYSTASVKYRAEEYEAITGETVVEAEDYGDFLREGVNISEYNIPCLKSISLIHKVREVQALIGFTRLKPVDSTDEPGAQGVIVPVKEPSTNWYPAYDVRGEGIFIEFDNSAIDRWRTENQALAERVAVLNENYKKSFIGENHPREITSKFLLLHTISHLLIKQLSFECGYGIASLKERIYCSETADGKEMSGVLIYTACGDSEGTLGGLVRQGRADTFPKIFNRAIENARTCSNDPVCSLSQGQGRDSLNLAACYSCALIPETSCEEFNSFLDRGVVVGTFENPNLGFFQGAYEGTTSPVKVSVLPDTPQSVLVYNGGGTDLRDSSYADIWNNLLGWATDDVEIELLSSLITKSDLFANKEKPVMNGTIIDTATQEEYTCDLIWKQSKTVFLFAENEDIIPIIQNGGWICFCGTATRLTVDEIIEAISEA
ncbi:MAG: DUF1998 domain-containing protein [Lachnospiraceae bacterium]|nr:DUF1998 domain-containing protein [Lachnospiraceae bacterium]